MKKLELRLKTVTPLFLAGVNNKGKSAQPELRAASFRGMMRYWFRATAGAVIGDKDKNQLKIIEDAVFGSTETGSSIITRIPFQKPETQWAKFLPHKDKSPGRVAIQSEEKFKLILSQRPGASDITWQVALSIFELSLLFGGVGLRSRRGFGTLRFSEPYPTSFKDYQIPSDKEELIKYVTRTVNNAVEAVGVLADELEIQRVSSVPSGPSPYPCANKLSEIRISAKAYENEMQAMAAFMGIKDKPYMGGIKPKRQGSPLWVRPTQVGDKFFLLYILLASEMAKIKYPEISKFLDRVADANNLVKGWNHD